MTNSALEKTVAIIEDTFRDERKAHQLILSQGHRLSMLVKGGRYSYHDGCKALGITAKQVSNSHKWLLDDNSRINAQYGIDYIGQSQNDWHVVGWMGEQEANKIVDMRAA